MRAGAEEDRAADTLGAGIAGRYKPSVWTQGAERGFFAKAYVFLIAGHFPSLIIFLDFLC